MGNSKTGRSPVATVPSSMLAYICAVASAAGLTAALGYAYANVPVDGVQLAILCLLAWLGTFVREKNAGPHTSISFGSIVLVSAVALQGPFGAAVVGASTYLFDTGRIPGRARAFNAGMAALLGALGGFVYLVLGGGPPQLVSGGSIQLVVRIGLPLIAADLVICALNALLIAGIVLISEGIPARRSAIRMLTTSGLPYVGYGVIGFILVVLWQQGGLGPFSAVLILMPLFVARWAFQQYGDEVRAHERTLSALVAAVETRDSHRRGHSARIAELAELISGALSLGHKRSDALRFAALLHDVGVIGIPAKVLARPEGLTDEDLVVIAQHPARGLEMVREIGFLAESFAGILHHHERFDGRGYPDGLVGGQIPEFARIIAVADAFDWLTTSSPSHPAWSVEAALAQLHERVGTHLDPVMVAALERALSRRPWTPERSAEGSSAGGGVQHDHDDLAVGDRMADGASLVQRRAAQDRAQRDLPSGPGGSSALTDSTPAGRWPSPVLADRPRADAE